MRNLVETIAKALVDNPDEVVVHYEEDDDSIVFKVEVASDDMGKVIGKHGRTAKALRSIVNAAATSSGKRVIVDIG